MENMWMYRDQTLGIVGLLSHYSIIWLPEYSYLSEFHDKTSIIIFGMTEIPE